MHHDEIDDLSILPGSLPQEFSTTFSAQHFAFSDTSYFVEQAQFTDRHLVS